ncbi:hypothetical protein Bca4012_031601 [Brassica carinata]
MHRFVLREDLHIRSRLSDSSSAMALGLLQILVIKKNIHDRSIILPVVYMILLIGHQTLETRPFNAMKRKCRNGWNHMLLGPNDCVENGTPSKDFSRCTESKPAELSV